MLVLKEITSKEICVAARIQFLPGGGWVEEKMGLRITPFPLKKY